MCVSVRPCPSFVYSLYVNWWLDINVLGTDETSETSTDRKKRNETKSGCKSTRHVILCERHVFNGDLKLWTYREGVHWGHRCQELISFSCSLFIFYSQMIVQTQKSPRLSSVFMFMVQMPDKHACSRFSSFVGPWIRWIKTRLFSQMFYLWRFFLRLQTVKKKLFLDGSSYREIQF